MEKRIEIEDLAKIKQLINNAELLLQKGNIADSIRSLYEAIKESIILLRAGLEEIKNSGNLDDISFMKIANKLSKILNNKDILYAWYAADYGYVLAEEGKLDLDTLKPIIEDMKELVKFVEKIVLE